MPPGGESAAEFRARVLSAFRSLVEDERDSLVVCHGGVIAAIMDACFPDAGKNRYDWQPAGGEGYEICFEGTQPLGWRKVPETGA